MENEESLYRLEIQDLLPMFKEIKKQPDATITKEEIDQVENGKWIKIPIEWYAYGFYNIYPHTKGVNVSGYGEYNLMGFIKEKEEREAIIRNIILKNQNNEATKPRVL